MGPRDQPRLRFTINTVKTWGEHVNKDVDFTGKRVIAIGERDGVQGNVIADIARELGAEVVFNITQCFV